MGIWTPYNTQFPGPTRVLKTNSILIASAVFALPLGNYQSTGIEKSYKITYVVKFLRHMLYSYLHIVKGLKASCVIQKDL